MYISSTSEDILAWDQKSVSEGLSPYSIFTTMLTMTMLSVQSFSYRLKLYLNVFSCPAVRRSGFVYLNMFH